MDDETRVSIDAVVESYVDARKNHESLTIDDLLQRFGAHDRRYLEALVLADARLRLAQKERVSEDDYLRQWPELLGTDCLKQVAQLSPSRVEFDQPHRSLSSGLNFIKKGVMDYEAGERVLQFEIIRTIGYGTHGCVYLAKDLTLRRFVALKVSAEFGVEGQALAKLDHPNVVRVFGEQIINGHKLLAMQFVPGRTLADFLRERPYQRAVDWNSRSIRRWIDAQSPPGDLHTRIGDIAGEYIIEAHVYDSLIVQWMIRLACALKHAHLRGVLHRDVKPSNVILDRYARPLLTDFNVARVETELNANEFGGTLPYMAPEHLRAYQTISNHSSDDVDARSDIYSLGVMLLELLSGQKTWGELPADGERLVPALLAQRLGGLPDAFARGVRPRSLRSVLQKCLAANPDQRYQSAGDLAADLDAWIDGRPLIHADGYSPSKRVVGFARRHPMSCALALTATVVCVGGLLTARSVSKARDESCREKIEQAKVALQSGDTTTASTLIGETRGMIRDPMMMLGESRGREIALHLQGLENEIRKAQFIARADVVRFSFASSVPSETIESAKRLLENYGVYRSDDWESRPPFSTLDGSSQRIIAEGITEIILMTLLRMQDSGSQADIARFVQRLPKQHQGLPLFIVIMGHSKTFSNRPEADLFRTTSRDSFEAHLLGMNALHHKRFDEAQVWFDRSAAWDGDNAGPRFWTCFWHARACEELNRVGQAIALYGTCVGQRPGFSWPRYNLARLLAEDGQLDSALLYIDSAIRADQRFARAYVLKSAILVKRGQYRDAIDVCHAVVPWADLSVDLHKNLAAAHAGLNEFEQAYEHLIQARRIAPGDHNLELDLARIKELLGPIDLRQAP